MPVQKHEIPGHVVVDPEEEQRVLVAAASSRPALAVIQAAGDETSPHRQRPGPGQGDGEGPLMRMSVSMSDDEFARREEPWRRRNAAVEAREEEEPATSGGIASPSFPSRDRRKAPATTENVHPPRVVPPSASCCSPSPPPRSITPHPTSFPITPPLSPPPSRITAGGGVGGVPPRDLPRRSHLATRSLSEPIMSSRLRLDPSARMIPARGFTKTAWDLARAGQLLPHVPIPCRVPIAAREPFLLSRRYARSASESFLSSRSPVQERSVPRFSSPSSSSFSSCSSSSSSFLSRSAPARKRHRASLGGSSNASTATHGSQFGTTSAAATAVPYDHRRLFEDLVLVTLERRLADRLARARAAESPPWSLSDKAAGSSPSPEGGGGGGNRAATAAIERAAGMGGGIRPGREMWIWSAVRRTRTREGRGGGGGGGRVAAAQSVFNADSVEIPDERSRLSAADGMRQIHPTSPCHHMRSTSLPAILPLCLDAAPSSHAAALPPPRFHNSPPSSSSPSSSPPVQIYTRHPFLPLRLRLPSRPVAAHTRPLSLLGTDDPGTAIARPALGGGDLATTDVSELGVMKKARGGWVLEERRRWGCRMPKRPERVAVAV